MHKYIYNLKFIEIITLKNSLKDKKKKFKYIVYIYEEYHYLKNYLYLYV